MPYITTIVSVTARLAASDLNLATAWEAIAAALPDRPAIACGELVRTWHEFDDRFDGATAAPGEAVDLSAVPTDIKGPSDKKSLRKLKKEVKEANKLENTGVASSANIRNVSPPPQARTIVGPWPKHSKPIATPSAVLANFTTTPGWHTSMRTGRVRRPGTNCDGFNMGRPLGKGPVWEATRLSFRQRSLFLARPSRR